jgi:uncharacterized membrane protein YphA (DoxX/SURF4 family)
LKAKSILYWVFTIISALELLAGAEWDLTRRPDAVGVVTQLGYPVYMLTIVGIWKALAVLALLVPGFPRLKEWAYAGVFFEMTGAAASHAAKGDFPSLLGPLVFAAFAMASWALRPENRTLGELFPAKKHA